MACFKHAKLLGDFCWTISGSEIVRVLLGVGMYGKWAQTFFSRTPNKRQTSTTSLATTENDVGSNWYQTKLPSKAPAYSQRQMLSTHTQRCSQSKDAPPQPYGTPTTSTIKQHPFLFVITHAQFINNSLRTTRNATLTLTFRARN